MWSNRELESLLSKITLRVHLILHAWVELFQAIEIEYFMMSFHNFTNFSSIFVSKSTDNYKLSEIIWSLAVIINPDQH